MLDWAFHCFDPENRVSRAIQTGLFPASFYKAVSMYYHNLGAFRLLFVMCFAMVPPLLESFQRSVGDDGGLRVCLSCDPQCSGLGG